MNEKILSIIIPHYDEPLKQLNSVFSSIGCQSKINFDDIEVIVVNDCGKPIEKEERDACRLVYPFDIIWESTPVNSGPGVARQWGIDHCRGEWVLFIDSDDSLYGPYTLLSFIRNIQNPTNPNFKMLIGRWVEEDANSDLKIDHTEVDRTWMHGKAFNKQWLIDNNVRFDDKIRINEDSYFLGILFSTFDTLSERVGQFMGMPCYIWRGNPHSQVRRNNNAFNVETNLNFVKVGFKLIKDWRNPTPQKIQDMIVELIVYEWFYFIQNGLLKKENEKWASEIVQEMKTQLKENGYWEKIESYLADKEKLYTLCDDMRKRIFPDIQDLPITLDDWIKKLK